MVQHEGELLERVFSRKNLKAALERVMQNRGAPGVDGMTVEELPENLRAHWTSIRTKLETGKYRPSPVPDSAGETLKRVEISQPGGGERKLVLRGGNSLLVMVVARNTLNSWATTWINQPLIFAQLY